jgi:signal transduction histidine kinase
VVSIAGTAIALLFRRRAPLTVLVVVTILTTVLGFSAESNLVLAVPIALYAVAAFRSPVVGWIAGAAAFAVTVASLFLWLPVLEARLGAPGAFDIPLVLLTIGMADTVGILLGANTWQRAENVRVLTERADQLARERDSRARIATLAERSRIAREMHDIVAHSLSVMITLADGASASVERDPAAARRALERLADTGRDALRDMRQVLSVLGDSSDEPASLQPAPGREALGELVARFREAGLPVRFTVRGAPVADPQRDLAVHRIVQEALTNALRYAADAERVDVLVDDGADATVVTVADDGRRASASVGAGRGLIGMSERAAVFGGSVEAGPIPSGGWRVRAVLPTEGAVADG